MLKIGSFTYENGDVTGPKAYMEERGFERLERIAAGLDIVANTAIQMQTGSTRNPVVAALVSLQTDFAAWIGKKELLARI